MDYSSGMDKIPPIISDIISDIHDAYEWISLVVTSFCV